MVLEGDSLEIIQALRREEKCWGTYRHFIDYYDAQTIKFPQWEVRHDSCMEECKCSITQTCEKSLKVRLLRRKTCLELNQQLLET